MENSDIKELISRDFRQTEKFANFLETVSFKPIKLKNNSLIFEFNFGKISVIKSLRNNLDSDSFLEINEIIKNKYNLVTKFAPNIGYDENLNTKYGYKPVKAMMSPTKTCVRDLREDIDDIYKSFSATTRYKISRSIREGDKVEIIQNPTNFQMYKFYEQLTERQDFKKFKSYNKKELTTLKNCFWEDSYLINCYNKEAKPVVSNFYIKNFDKVTYVAGSLNSEEHKSKAGFQMIFEAFKFFKNIGVKIYDFEGLSDERNKEYYDEWLGFTNFKLKFSNHTIYYPETIVKYNNTLFKALTRIFGK